MFFVIPAPSLKLIDLPGLDQRSMDDSRVSRALQLYDFSNTHSLAMVIFPLMLWGDGGGDASCFRSVTMGHIMMLYC